jgi:hypothetical protein
LRYSLGRKTLYLLYGIFFYAERELEQAYTFSVVVERSWVD